MAEPTPGAAGSATAGRPAQDAGAADAGQRPRRHSSCPTPARRELLDAFAPLLDGVESCVARGDWVRVTVELDPTTGEVIETESYAHNSAGRRSELTPEQQLCLRELFLWSFRISPFCPRPSGHHGYGHSYPLHRPQGPDVRPLGLDAGFEDDAGHESPAE